MLTIGTFWKDSVAILVTLNPDAPPLSSAHQVHTFLTPHLY